MELDATLDTNVLIEVFIKSYLIVKPKILSFDYGGHFTGYDYKNFYKA